ncbi:unnamed protein product [Rhodiola kirilowii]
MSTMTAVVSPKFVSPHPLDLTIVRTGFFPTNGYFDVTDSQRSLLFEVEDRRLFTVSDLCVILDAKRSPVVTIRKKFWTMHSTWEVFKGESSYETNLLFSIKRTSIFQTKTKLQVFLATNKDENVCDYNVQGSWLNGTCAVYAGQSSNIVAQMHKRKFTLKNILFWNNKFKVTVYPNTDYCLITSIFIIIDAIINSTSSTPPPMIMESTLL